MEHRGRDSPANKLIAGNYKTRFPKLKIISGKHTKLIFMEVER